MRELTRRPAPRATASLPRFEPGTLVTAELLNRLVDHIAALEARVAVLEGRQ